MSWILGQVPWESYVWSLPFSVFIHDYHINDELPSRPIVEEGTSAASSGRRGHVFYIKLIER